MTEADRLQGFPKIHKERKTDGPGRNAQRTIRGERSPREQLGTYLGKSCRRVLLSCVPSPTGFGPIEVLRARLLFIYFFSALAVLACVSMPSCQNSLKETAAGELRNVSQNLGLVWGLEDSYRKLKRFLGQCVLWVFPLLLLTFSFFNFFFHFYLVTSYLNCLPPSF